MGSLQWISFSRAMRMKDEVEERRNEGQLSRKLKEAGKSFRPMTSAFSATLTSSTLDDRFPTNPSLVFSKWLHNNPCRDPISCTKSSGETGFVAVSVMNRDFQNRSVGRGDIPELSETEKSHRKDTRRSSIHKDENAIHSFHFSGGIWRQQPT